MLKRFNNNAYQIDLPEKYGIPTTFNIMDLTPFVGNKDKDVEALYLRTNYFQEKGDDGRGPMTNSNASPQREDLSLPLELWPRRFRKTMATGGRETSQYMFKDAITLV